MARAEPLLHWHRKMDSLDAAKYWMTNGFIAVELYRVTVTENEKLKEKIKELEDAATNRRAEA